MPEVTFASILRRLHRSAVVAELADARGSGPRTRKGVGVRVPSSAPINQTIVEQSSGPSLGSGFRLWAQTPARRLKFESLLRHQLFRINRLGKTPRKIPSVA